MKVDRIIAAWKDEEARSQLSTAEEAELPGHPAGPLATVPPNALADANGQNTWIHVIHFSYSHCGEIWEEMQGMPPAGPYHQNPDKYYCFAAQTPVRTPQGSAPIAALDSGDRILAFDQDLGAVREARVVAREEHTGSFPLFDLISEGEGIQVTAGHRFHGPDGWRAVEAFSGRQRFLDSRQQRRRLHLEASASRAHTVYNLRVEGLQTYLVGHQELLVRDH